MASVPNTNTFTLNDVYIAVSSHASPSADLSDCFAKSVDAYFDPLYKGAKTSLYNFRNYTPVGTTTTTTAGPTTTTTTTTIPSGIMVIAGTNGSMLYLSSDLVNWTNKISNKTWNDVERSSTGQYMIAAPNGSEYFYTSTDYGVNWSVRNTYPTNDWQCCAISDTGQYQWIAATSAIDSDGLLYRSSNYGSTFTSAAYPTSYFGVLQMDGTGQYGLGVGNNKIYRTSDYGANWTQISLAIVMFDGALSSTGQYQYLCGTLNGGYYVYKSTNYGSSWSNIYSTTYAIYQISCSNDGQYVTLGGNNIITSSNGGSTFTVNNTINVSPYQFTKISQNGQHQFAITNNSSSYIYYSNNYGSTWTTIGPLKYWSAIDAK